MATRLALQQTANSTLNVPLINLTPGHAHVGTLTLASTVSALVLTIDRTVTNGAVLGMNALTSASSYDIKVEESLDGGVTWPNFWEFTNVGGPIENIDKFGVDHGPLLADVMTTNLGDAGAPSREVRLTVTPAGPSKIAVQGSLVIS